MTKKLTIRIVCLLVAVFAGFIAYSVASAFIPRHGTAAHVSDLRPVYAKAGTRIAFTFTNSLIQRFPFDGPIDWKLMFFKDTALFLSGRVDTNGLHQFIVSHPATRFIWTGAGSEIEEGWPSDKVWPRTTTWTNVWFKTEWNVEGYPTSIEGRVDTRSRLFTFQIW